MRVLRSLTSRPRLLLAAGIFVFVAALFPWETRATTRGLVAWDIALSVYLLLVAIMMSRSDNKAIQRRADIEDTGTIAVLLLTVVAATAGLAAIGAELHGLHDSKDHQFGRIALAGLTILLSWLFVHTIFALHYAHDYYAGEDDRGGLKFPGDNQPDYWDFLYFAFNMGAASQTSDVMVTAPRMRRFVLAHTLLSFFFNTTILALGINVGASLL